MERDGAGRRGVRDAYYRRRIWEAIGDLSLLELAPNERRQFVVIYRGWIREHEARLRWQRRGALLSGMGATVGGTLGAALLPHLLRLVGVHW